MSDDKTILSEITKADITESGYNRSYYEEHKEEIKRKRKERYLNDPIYREKLRSQARQRKRRKLQDAVEERERKGLPKPRIGSPKPEWFLVHIQGKDIKLLMHSPKDLAKALGKTTNTIRRWEKIGALPPAMYHSKKGRIGSRLYTQFQIEQICILYAEAIRINGHQMVEWRIGATVFPGLVEKLWKNFPLGLDPERLDQAKE